MTNVFAVDPSLVDLHKTDPPVSSCTDHPNGTVLRRPSESTAWIKERDPNRPDKSAKRKLGVIDLVTGHFGYAFWTKGDRLLASWGFKRAKS